MRPSETFLGKARGQIMPGSVAGAYVEDIFGRERSTGTLQLAAIGVLIIYTPCII